MRRIFSRAALPGWLGLLLEAAKQAYRGLDAWGNAEFFIGKIDTMMDFLTVFLSGPYPLLLGVAWLTLVTTGTHVRALSLFRGKQKAPPKSVISPQASSLPIPDPATEQAREEFARFIRSSALRASGMANGLYEVLQHPSEQTQMHGQCLILTIRLLEESIQPPMREAMKRLVTKIDYAPPHLDEEQNDFIDFYKKYRELVAWVQRIAKAIGVDPEPIKRYQEWMAADKVLREGINDFRVRSQFRLLREAFPSSM